MSEEPKKPGGEAPEPSETPETPAASEASETQELPKQKHSPFLLPGELAFREKKERLYDKLPVTVKMLDILIGVCIFAIVAIVVLSVLGVL